MKIRIILTALSAALLGILIATLARSLPVIPRVTQYNYNQASGEEAFTIERVLKIDERIDEINVGVPELSFCADGGEVEVRGHKLSLVLVNENFFKNYGISCGEFKENSAVISRSLALDLFYTEEVKGQRLDTEVKSFSVSGVYDDWSDDGVERVYVHYKSLGNWEKAKVYELAAKNGGISALGLEQMKLTNYYRTDLVEKRKVLEDFAEIAKLVLFVLLCLGLLKFRGFVMRREKEKIRLALGRDYAFRSVLRNPKDYSAYLLALAGIPVALIAVFLLIRVNIYIIPGYIPKDNFFDIPYYFEQMNKAAQSLNQARLLGNLSYIRFYHDSFMTLMFETIGFTCSAAVAYAAWAVNTKYQ